MVRSQIPKFRLPDSVIDEECGYILDLGVELHFDHWVKSLKDVLTRPGLGRRLRRHRRAARARRRPPGRQEAAAHIHIGIDWLANVAFGHTTSIAKRVIVLGGGNTAMDCCRSARRSAATDVKVVVRSGFDEMKASPWEKEDAMHEGIPIINMHVPKEFVHENGKLTGVLFEKSSRPNTTRRGGASSFRPASRMCSWSATKCWWPSARKTPSPGSRRTSA
jgi:formate dehydrogenase beta subunit